MPHGKGTWDIHYRRWTSGVLWPRCHHGEGRYRVRPALDRRERIEGLGDLDDDRDTLPSCAIEGGRSCRNARKSRAIGRVMAARHGKTHVA